MVNVPIAEQLEELEAEWDRRNRDYPLLVAKGELRYETSELKQERLAAAIRTLGWIKQHRDILKEYVLYATKVGMMQPKEEPIEFVPEPDF